MKARGRKARNGTTALLAALALGALAVAAEPAPVVLVSADEPGEPLLLGGTVYAADGVTPLAGVRVHVHQTNKNGIYTRLGSGGEGTRIEGEFVTDADGRYLFSTIRPASYPGDGPPAHVHYKLTGPGGLRKGITLHFTGDGEPAEDRFAAVQPLRPGEDGVLRCTFDIRMDD